MSSPIRVAPKDFRPPTIKSKDFDALVEKWMKEWKVPGLALAVIDGAETTVKV
jgi:CubicO group peptidase (beta-lactamase class C family)